MNKEEFVCKIALSCVPNHMQARLNLYCAAFSIVRDTDLGE